MEKKRRIVVTGMGVVSCFGMDADAFYEDLLEGKSGVRKMERFDASEYPTNIAAEVADFDPEGYLDKKQARRNDLVIQFGMVAGKKALEMANLTDTSGLDLDRCGVIVGSGMGGMRTFADGVTTVNEKGFKRLSPFFIPFIITNMPGALLAIELGFKGPNYSISTACATGTHSIVSAARHIEKGEADVMVCGGTEAIVDIGLAGFVACKALSTNNDDPKGASRPWSEDRDGFVMGEGAGVLILEEYEHAKARGATIYAEYYGGYVNCDANHMTDPISDGSGVAKCIEKALEDADLPKERVNYVNAHATSTPVGDMCEIRAIHKAFGPHAKNLKVNATKSMVGHALGAAGGIEAVATVCAIHKKKLHPTINCLKPEAELGDLDIVNGKSIDFDVDIAVSNSFGFGGHNAVIVLGKYED
ncbi:MAG: beta-ketoacyl-ACP synthase II [Simkaniaceae bacterium]|nr:beta-ketoacyl-ACP synthase II [Simkaniaceae bacterium]